MSYPRPVTCPPRVLSHVLSASCYRSPSRRVKCFPIVLTLVLLASCHMPPSRSVTGSPRVPWKTLGNSSPSLKVPEHKTNEFLKNSISLPRNNQNQQSRVPKTSQSRPKIFPRLCQNPAEFLIDFCIDLLLISVQFWDALWRSLASKNFQ